MKYAILGKSRGTLSVLLENLFSLHGSNFEVDIVTNMKDTSELKYEIEGVVINEFGWEEYRAGDTMDFILGATTVGNKKRIFDFYGLDKSFFCNIIPKKTAISKTVTFERGVMLNCGCTLAPYVQIGNFVTVGRNTSVGHHTTIGDFTTIGQGANIGGKCRIESKVTIGMGANVREGLTVGEGATVGAGALVLNNVPPNVVVFGVPAKIAGKL